MKKMNFMATIILSAVAILSMNSCKGSKEDPKMEAQLKKVEFLDVTHYDKWVYFNFEKGSVVKVTDLNDDMSKDLSWDVAFHRWDVKTNSGTSGIGKGGALKSSVQNFDKIANIEGSYRIDEMGKIISKFEVNNGKHNMEQAEASLNPILSGSKAEKIIGWIDTTHGERGPKYEITPNLYFIKTADGKVVAIKFTGHKNAELKTGFISFEYSFIK